MATLIAKPDYVPTFRYARLHAIKTHLDPLQDMLSWLSFLTAKDYVMDLCMSRHGLSKKEGQARAGRIKAHVTYAREFFEQALGGNSDVAFLPGYYGILNLLKSYVLFGPFHHQLETQRTHGVSYDGLNKKAFGLLTDTVCMFPKGAIALFYQTVTGSSIRTKRSVRVGDLYPYIADIGAEYTLTTGKSSQVSFAMFALGKQDKNKVEVTFENGFSRSQQRAPTLLRGYRRTSTEKCIFGRPLSADGSPEERVRQTIRPELLYLPDWQNPNLILSKTAMRNGHLLFPEEVPIALAWFHLGSVVRYNPEFLARLRDSREWAMIDAMRRHSLLRMLTCFLSFAHQETIAIA